MPNSYQSTDIEEKIRVESLIISHQKANPSTQVLTKAKELEEAKAEMGEVREENERLKTVLQHIKNDYKSLQLRFFDIIKQDQSENLHDLQKPSTESQKKINSSPNNRSRQNEEAELVSLSLGRSSTPRDDQAKNLSTDQKNYDHYKGLKADDLTLGLGSETKVSTEVIASDESAENSSEDQAKELTEFPKKNSNYMRNDNDEVSHDQQSQAAKRARVCVRARCDTPTMNDGCQWRKYGQKIAKGNPCPRAYYRCTVAPSCPVRKQVQRCAEDMSILITTYEGAHNHPLPVTATAMASTTSAAASMLLSGSSTSPEHMTSRFTPINASKNNSPTSTSTTLINNNGLNSSHFDTNFNLRPKPFYLPNNNSLSSTLFPTITLDLTASPISQSSSSHFMNKSSSLSSLPSSFPRIPSSSLSFSNNASELNNLPTLWGNGSSFLGYNGNKILPYERHKASQIGNSLNLGRALQSQEFLHHHNHLHHKQANVVDNSVQDTLTETLTKAITADPSAFKSVIAAAISSVMGKQDGGGAERLGQRLTLGHDQNGKGLASSYFNGLPSSNF